MGNGRGAGSKCAISLKVFQNWKKKSGSWKGKDLINKEKAKYRILDSSFITVSSKAAIEEPKFNYWRKKNIYMYFSNINAHMTHESPEPLWECSYSGWGRGAETLQFCQTPRCRWHRWWGEDRALNSKSISSQQAGMISLHCTQSRHNCLDFSCNGIQLSSRKRSF